VQRSHAVIVFTQYSKNGFLPLQGRHVALINVKFGKGRNVGIQPRKLSKFGILGINLPIRGDTFAPFV